jgi:hypothetical protein
MKYIHEILFVVMWGLIVLLKLIADKNPTTFDLATLIGAGIAMNYFKKDDN